MSLFQKRKGRRISTFDDEEEESGGGASVDEAGSAPEPAVQLPVRFGRRQLKQSALRRSINLINGGAGGDEDQTGESSGTATDRKSDKEGEDDVNTNRQQEHDEDGESRPVVVRPNIGRSGSTRTKKRLSSSSTRLSFGGSALGDGDNDDDSVSSSGPGPTSTMRRAPAGTSSLTQRVLETNAFRRSLSGRLPARPIERLRDSGGDQDDDIHDFDDDDRPRYSAEYLAELQSSTPNTPQNTASMRKQQNDAGGGSLGTGDAMDLDPSELEGAMVVDASELAALRPATPVAHVLTETEIQERKDRRARLALEKEALALGSDDDEANGYISLAVDTKKQKQKEATRLVREDEDLGEGFDEFVEDERLALGRKAERAARRRRKQEMAALIEAAEKDGGDGDGLADGNRSNDDIDDDDSEAERRAAYDAAQARAGMDGLARRRKATSATAAAAAAVDRPVAVPRMKPLPDLADCVARMRSTVQALAGEVALRREKLADVEREKQEIAAREKEVQAILDKAGATYQAALGTQGKNGVAAAAAATQSPLRPLPPGLMGALPTERGLESLGTTPTRKNDPDDVFTDRP
ncbi:hypothetical protein SPI_04426 [Niveomyces insectorum RCEF 264]|uniref:Nineteen complex-related protein 2-domain-containing protein n=1 Tax=Niveomyces insectorum RCEF 264 TaxID=1081102 RepID=A0A167VQM8_9HYPO|nr:hypothetical protein SPI_04426 [Niveomyces insectorum RCEF 264]